PEKKSVLVFTKSSGWEHDVVKRVHGEPSIVENAVTSVGRKHGFNVTATKDGNLFDSKDFHQYDAFFFYTTGDLTTAGTDKNPPMTAEGRQKFLDLIRQGKGFIGTHSATDTFHSPGAQTGPGPTTHVDPYIEMIGGEFITHGEQQPSRVRVTDPKFPGMA